MSKEASCAERIEKSLERRLETLMPDVDDMDLDEAKELCDWHGIDYDKDDELETLVENINDDLQDRISESVLSIDKEIVFNICLSTGGPADGFKLVSDGTSWIGGSYYFQDWYDGAESDLDLSTVDSLAAVFGLEPDTET